MSRITTAAALRGSTAFRATLAGLALGAVGLAAPVAHAHMGSTKVVQAQLTEHGADLDVHVEAVDAAIALGMGTSADATELAQHAALVQGWLKSGLVVSGASGPCTPTPAAPRLTERDGKDDVSVALSYDCPQPMGIVTLSDHTVFDDDPDHEVFVSVTGPTGEQAHVLRAGERSVELGAPADATATTSAAATAGTFVVEGAIHLATGWDHLLFLLSLILAAGLIVERDGLRAALRDVAAVVTAFTIGHSLSLVAASLGWLTLPSRWVESAIAASIVAVAGMNVTRPRASVARPWLAGAFGLVHGFGFSSVLADVGLPASQRLLALLSFNVGIELAQLAFVAAILIPLGVVARHERYRLVVVQGGSLAIAVCGCFWLAQRVMG